MRYTILLVVLFSCVEDGLKKECNYFCFRMTISDATPIQFWINGEETFNQSNPICGLTDACFCQPFQCDDEITIQVTDESLATYAITIYDAEDNELATVDFEEVSDGVFQVTFIPSELSPPICEKIRFKIFKTGTIETFPDIVNGSIIDTIAPSTSEESKSEGAGIAWTYTGAFSGSAISEIGNGPSVDESTTQWFSMPLAIVSGQTYRFEITFRINDGGNGAGAFTTMVTRLANVGEDPFGGDFLWTEFLDLGTQTLEVEMTATENKNAFQILFQANDAAGYLRETLILLVDLLEPVGEVVTPLDPSIEMAASDCIDLRNNHECSKLISYTNADDFDGINYDISPQPTFYLRVPAQLLEDENPQTQEDLELSNGTIVTVRQTIQEKSILKLGYMPPYMHTKMQKVLMHDTVIIDDMQWKRRDAYEAPRIEDYPLKKGEVLLTKYNSVLKNTI